MIIWVVPVTVASQEASQSSGSEPFVGDTVDASEIPNTQPPKTCVKSTRGK